MQKPIQGAKKSRPRLPEVDFFRGIAILMMAVFHFMWNLDYFSVTSGNLYSGFWGVFQKLTGGLFIFLVGVSLTLSYSRSKERYPIKFIARGFRIFCYGLMITVFSYFFSAENTVFFGILHFIGIATIIATPFIRYTCVNFLFGCLFLGAGVYLSKFTLSFPWLVWVWHNHPVNTLDLYPLLPWLGIVFLGLFLGNVLYPDGRRRFKATLPTITSKISRPVEFLGRNSLIIYFIHLPVMFGLAFVVSLIV